MDKSKKSVAILDDDSLFVEILAERVSSIFQKQKLDISLDCYSEAEKLEASEKKYDLIFMDIVMPDRDGISLVQEWRCAGRFREVIFVSAYDDEVFRTFAGNPLAFVRKTHLDKDLELAVSLYYKRIMDTQVLIPEGKKIHVVCPEEIMYLSSRCHYIEFHMWNGEIMVIRGKMDDMDGILNRFGFVRIHVSYLVNMTYVALVDKTQVCLRNKEVFRISVRYRAGVLDRMRSNLITGVFSDEAAVEEEE